MSKTSRSITVRYYDILFAVHEPVASFDCSGNYRIISIFPARVGSKMIGIEKEEGLMVRYVEVRLMSVRLERRLIQAARLPKQSKVRD